MSTDTRLQEAAQLRDEGMAQAEGHADPRLMQSNLPTTKTKRITVWRGVTS